MDSGRELPLRDEDGVAFQDAAPLQDEYHQPWLQSFREEPRMQQGEAAEDERGEEPRAVSGLSSGGSSGFAQGSELSVKKGRKGSNFLARAGSFVGGLHGYGIPGISHRRRTGGRSSTDSVPYMCPECHFPLKDSTQNCPACDDPGQGLDADGRVPTMLTQAPSSPSQKRQFFCMLPQPQAAKDKDFETDKRSTWVFGRVLDPRGRRVKHWTRFSFVMASVSLFADPCYLYTFSFTSQSSCVYIQAGLAIFAAFLSALCFLTYAIHSYLSFRIAYVSRESMFLGRGELIFDARAVAKQHLFSPLGFPLDLIVMLPIPQILVFIVSPLLFNSILDEEWGLAKILGFIFLLVMVQYTLKVVHIFTSATRVQRVNGYVFGTVWWGFVLNFVVFVITAHALGALWYVEAFSSGISCVHSLCAPDPTCTADWMICHPVLALHPPEQGPLQTSWGGPGSNVSMTCFQTGNPGSWDYGIYSYAVPLLQDNSSPEKIMYGLFFGMMTCATFGNALVPAPDAGQALFSFIFVLCGLLLFTTLIGNIGVFLAASTARLDEMRMRRGNMDWWMRRRQLPSELQARVRQQERLSFVATRGMREDDLLEALPSSLKRQVKRQLCGDLVRSVPLFRSLDDLIVDSICAQLRPCVLSFGTELVRQGEPMHEMLFIARGKIRSTHTMASGGVSTCDMGPGSFCGEEVLSWSLCREEDQMHLPASSATLTADSILELYSLSAEDLRSITSHYRFQLRERRLRRLIKYYSPHWRTWAAITIQIWWRRGKRKAARRAAMGDTAEAPTGSLGSESTLELFSALLQAPKPDSSLARSMLQP